MDIHQAIKILLDANKPIPGVKDSIECYAEAMVTEINKAEKGVWDYILKTFEANNLDSIDKEWFEIMRGQE